MQWLQLTKNETGAAENTEVGQIDKKTKLGLTFSYFLSVLFAYALMLCVMSFDEKLSKSATFLSRSLS